MRRIRQIPRVDWPSRLLEVGFHYHSIDERGDAHAPDPRVFRYWREDAAYRFDGRQIERLYEAAVEVHRMCLEAVAAVVAAGDPERFAIPSSVWPLVERSWQLREPSLFGRFDFAWDGEGDPRLLEYNADTPTSLVEASLAQWQWVTQTHPGADQFNSLHEALIERWRVLRGQSAGGLLHLACLFDSQEDVGNTEYLMDLAVQAGWQAKILDMRDIGSDGAGRFVDGEEREIGTLFKLYPWEWMAREAFAPELQRARLRWIEPAWKMLLANKAILAELWDRFPGHPNLLPSFRSPGPLAGRAHVVKPLLSREGANVRLLRPGHEEVGTGGPYGAEGVVWQAYAPIREHDGFTPVLGVWIVGDDACGLGIREDTGQITRNTSFFVPHYFY